MGRDRIQPSALLLCAAALCLLFLLGALLFESPPASPPGDGPQNLRPPSPLPPDSESPPSLSSLLSQEPNADLAADAVAAAHVDHVDGVRLKSAAGGGGGHGDSPPILPDNTFHCRPRAGVWPTVRPVAPEPASLTGHLASLCERGVARVYLQGIPKSGTTMLEVAVVELLTRHCAKPESRCSVLGRPRSPGDYPLIFSAPDCQFEFEVPQPHHYVVEAQAGAQPLYSKHLYGGRLLQEPRQLDVLRNPCNAVLRVVRNPRDTLVSAFFWNEGKNDVALERLIKTAWRHGSKAQKQRETDEAAAAAARPSNDTRSQSKRLLDFAESQFPRLLHILEMQTKALHGTMGGEWHPTDAPAARLHTVFYEGMVETPIDELALIGQFFGIAPSAATLNETAHAISFQTMKKEDELGELPGMKGRVKVRSGKPNGYAELFSGNGLACLEQWLDQSDLPDSLRQRYQITRGARARMGTSKCQRHLADIERVTQNLFRSDNLFKQHVDSELEAAIADPKHFEKNCLEWLRCLDYVPKFQPEKGA